MKNVSQGTVNYSKKPGFFKELKWGFSAQIHNVTLTKTCFCRKGMLALSNFSYVILFMKSDYCDKRWISITADFIKKVLSVYTHSMTTIYLSLSAQVARSTFFMKSPVPVWFCCIGGSGYRPVIVYLCNDGRCSSLFYPKSPWVGGDMVINKEEQEMRRYQRLCSKLFTGFIKLNYPCRIFRAGQQQVEQSVGQKKCSFFPNEMMLLILLIM